MRVLTLAVRPRAPIEAGVGPVRRGRDRRPVDRRRRRALGDGHELVVGRGETWEQALEDVEWADGDVLVVGSSSVGPLARVFLGSRAAKIVRHSPVPVVVVPRESPTGVRPLNIAKPAVEPKRC